MKIIKKNNDFYGLFSDTSYSKNDIIHELCGSIYDNPSRTTIEIGINKHIDDEFGIYINHSFAPNCIIKDECIIACKDILEEEELTFDYNASETSMSYPFIDNETNIGSLMSYSITNEKGKKLQIIYNKTGIWKLLEK